MADVAITRVALRYSARMLLSLMSSAFLMGLVGGPHCVAMCGAACAGIAAAGAPRQTQALWRFQASRWVGYALMGALAGGLVQGLGWVGAQTAWLRPLWMGLHVAVLLLAVSLLWLGRQPAFVDGWAQATWRRTRPLLAALGPRAPVLLGMGWALMPCGLLYSGLMLATLSAGALEGAAVMAAFAVGTTVSLGLAPTLLLALRQPRWGTRGMRLAGLALALSSSWALWMGFSQPTGLWCA